MGNDSGIYHLYNYSNNPKIKKNARQDYLLHRNKRR